MPKYTEDWYEDDAPFEEMPFFTSKVSVVEAQSLSLFQMVRLNPLELQESQRVGRAAWQRYRDEIEEQIKRVFEPQHETDLIREVIAYIDWMKYGVLRYGYLDDGELSDEQIAMMLEAVYKLSGNINRF